MMNDEWTKAARACSSHSSVISHHSSLTSRLWPLVSGLSPRPGITLLEVLISILVLSVGILAMATLIPVGAYELSEAAKADATSTLGRAAFRDLEVRGFLNPPMWIDVSTPGRPCVDPSTLAWSAGAWSPPINPTTIVIDPLFVSLNPGPPPSGPSTPPAWYFPCKAVCAPALWSYPLLQLNRMTLRSAMNALAGPLSPAMTDRVFRAGDDLIFDAANIDRKRPAMTYLRDASNNAMQSQFTGNYSWFVTLSPSADEMGNRAMSRDSMWTYFDGAKFVGQQGSASDLTLGPALTRQYTATVVICYKRDFTAVATAAANQPAPKERMLTVTGVYGGYAGGEVQLQAEPGYETWLDFRPGQWLMLSLLTPAPANQVMVDWYRVVAVDREVQYTGGSPAKPYRYVTLHGSDIPLNYQAAFATVVEGVIGVYQKTITLDGDSAWSR
ncbi:MAG: hypothetical protein HYX69_14990 [Planctomycetia bacterium]|nr:hypothetical protein [Planctomycetia bacterium]